MTARGARVRPLARVPMPVWLLLGAALALQLAIEIAAPRLAGRYAPLPQAPSPGLARVLALGDAELAGAVLMLALQAHDTQPGYSAPLGELDYARVVEWLELALALAPRSHYPLLAAVRIYAAVNDPDRQRIVLEFVHRAFLEDPLHRWRWMAEAAILAKHRLRDLDLALEYATAITREARGPEVPAWARDMVVAVLEDRGELEAAQLLIGGLIHDGRITDPNELRFLERKLAELEARAGQRPPPR